MFDVDQYDRRLHDDAPAVPEEAYTSRDDISEMSLLYWGENCIECAAPSCYETCDLYHPRADKRCRRFQFGMYKNPSFRSLRGYGVEVSFKKWGLMGAMGNTSMVSRSRVIWAERLLRFVLRGMNAIGPVVRLVSRDDRWKYPTFGISRKLIWWLHRNNRGSAKPDAFVLEVYNPGKETVRMQLAMDFPPEARKGLAQTVQIQPRFRAALGFPPGYSRHDFERRLFQSVTESGMQFTISLTPQADTTARLVFLLADFVKYRSPASSEKKPLIKCVVWDLDNTLWDGVLVENDDAPLKPVAKRILEHLDERGILLSIASKNDYDLAWRRLQSLGIAEYFLSPQINWFPKSDNIKTIAEKLNIGVDSLAFIDDNPFELGEVAAAVPQVTSIDARDMGALLQDPRFQGSNTADAKHRRRYYKDAIVREEKQGEFGDDYLRFLKYCEIRLGVERYKEVDFERVAELVQRTNQLNFSGRKYDRDRFREVLNDVTLEKYVLSCSDRFGLYGLIGFAMVRQLPEEIYIQDLMLSCRVQGKFIEAALFSHFQVHHNPARAVRVRVNFNETNRNQPARLVLEAAKFRKLQSGEFALDIEPQNIRESDIVHVTCAEVGAAELVPGSMAIAHGGS